MPALPIASVSAHEAAVAPTTPADNQAAKVTNQTFTSLLTTLMDGDKATQPPAPKKLPTDLDAYSAQLKNPPAPLAQPVIILAAVPRLHFFFPTTPSSKVIDTKTQDANEADQDSSTPVPTIASPAPFPVPGPQPAPEQQPVLPEQTSTTPHPVTPQLASPQLATPQPATIQPVSPPHALAGPPTVTALPSKTPGRASSSQATLQPSSANKQSVPSVVEPIQNAQAVAPVILTNQPSEPQRSSANASNEPRSRSSQSTAATSSAPLPSALSSVVDKPASAQNDSGAPRISVNAEGATPLRQADLAFALKLTAIPAAQPMNYDATPAPATGSSPANSAAIRASRTTLNFVKPEANATGSTETLTPAPAPPQSATGSGDDQTTDSATRTLPKSQVKVQADTAEPAIESSATEKAQPLPQAVAPLLPPVSSASAVEPAALPTAVKTLTEPESQPADARPAVAALPEMNTAQKSEPVRDLSIRIGDSPGNQVDVKIQERAGEVHVAVLSNSPSLTTDLHQQVGELVGKLDRTGYHAETFRPTSSTASQHTSSQSDSGQQQSSAGGQQQQQEDSRQQFFNRQRKTNQSQWLQQLSGSLAPAAVEGIEKQ